MGSVKRAAAEFLANKRVAITGVLPSAQGYGANAVYKRLRERGYDVFAANPGQQEAEGDPCYITLRHIPGGIGAVVIAGPPADTGSSMRECAELGITHVWVHRAGGSDSGCTEATASLQRNPQSSPRRAPVVAAT